MDADRILEIAQEIKRSPLRKKEKTKKFTSKYSEFATKYPGLFAMCCNPSSDIEQLGFMIQMLRSMQNNQMTEHVASANVGKQLFETYVKPNIDEEAEMGGAGADVGASK
jgi:hypothetical protein